VFKLPPAEPLAVALFSMIWFLMRVATSTLKAESEEALSVAIEPTPVTVTVAVLSLDAEPEEAAALDKEEYFSSEKFFLLASQESVLVPVESV
jgi:hypothetical protein